jgi:hypothetical protein
MLVSGIIAVIHSREEPFGVLCAHSNIHRAFTEDDMSFMQAVANVLGGAIERNEAQERLEEVREAERSRLARDLHDEALQDLSGAMAEVQLARRVNTTGARTLVAAGAALCGARAGGATGARMPAIIGVSTSFKAEGTKSPLYRIDCGFVGVCERRTR